MTSRIRRRRPGRDDTVIHVIWLPWSPFTCCFSLRQFFILWIVGEWNRRRRERRALQYRLRCVICAFEFEDRRRPCFRAARAAGV